MLVDLPAVSVIVPLGKHEELLAKQISSVLAQDYPRYEIILARSSIGGSEALTVRITDPRIRLVEGPARNPAGLRNLGAANSRHDLLAFLDSDCMPDADWLTKFVEAKQRLGTKAIVGASRSANEQASKWARVAARRYAIWIEGASRGETLKRIDTKNLMIEKPYLDSLGGFDDRLDSKEDRDLALRVMRSGHLIGYARDACVSHHDPVGLSQIFRRAMWYAKGMNQFRAKYGIGPFSGSVDEIFFKRYSLECVWALASIAYFASLSLLAVSGVVREMSLLWAVVFGLVLVLLAFRSLLRSFGKFMLGRSSWEDLIYDLACDLGHKIGGIGSILRGRLRGPPRGSPES